MITSIIRRPRVSSVALRTAKYSVAKFHTPSPLNNKNDLLLKYQDKLQEKARSLGAKNVDELRDILKDDIKKTKESFNKVDPLEALNEYERKQSEESRQSKTIKVRSPISQESEPLPYKTLDSFIDTDKIRELPATEIEMIWKARFQHKDRSLFATLKSLQFASMYANAFKNPQFILPLPKNDGEYEMQFVQWSFVGPNTCHCMLTTVAEYKLHKEYAKPHTTLMFHQELATTKDIVLMNGVIDKDAALRIDEAELLVLNIQRFYGAMNNDEGSETRQALLENFSKGSEDFSLDALIKVAETFN
ncbi:uncharacterized protein PRCAT00001805001 [Priceomyces carsonii]|uniref:uncharacterized protein n=1 Tax=Priceomyces carsonii TaxID=28549 RepID=UPI002EDA8BA3|nr:unnamed protein product [Priceomyces carsonii]